MASCVAGEVMLLVSWKIHFFTLVSLGMLECPHDMSAGFPGQLIHLRSRDTVFFKLNSIYS